MNLYANLDLLKSEIKSDATGDDAILVMLCEAVSRRVDLELDPSGKVAFLPVIASKRLPMQSWRLEENGQTYNPHFPLQELDSVSINGTTDITTKVELDIPYRLHWKLSEAGDFLTSVAYEHGVKARLHIAGTWVFQNDYDQAWVLASTLSAAIISTTATTITINAPTHDIAVGDILGIGSEYLEVTDVDETTLIVVRGVNGSTAATHLISASVYVFIVEPPIARAVAKQVGLMYSRRGAYMSQSYDGIGTVQFPEDEVAELRNVVGLYRAVLSA